MKHAPVRALALLMSLIMLAMPLSAQAEAGVPVPNMFTFVIDNISYSTDGEITELPVSFEMSMGWEGASLDDLRAAALISLTSGYSSAALMGSIESGEVRARVSGIDTGILMPYGKALDAFISQTLLMGLTYDQISEETREALDKYLTLLEESMTAPIDVSEPESALEALYPRDAWLDDYEKYPALLNATPAGDEEITLFGTTYTAHKYTYSFARLTGEEYDQFYQAYDEHFYGAVSELEEALAELEELVWADFDAVYGDSYGTYNPDVIWTDDGTLTGGISLSEWDEEQPDDITYSIEGTIWQVDEVLGMLETYTATTHAPDGETVETCTISDMLTDTAMRMETVSSSKDSYGNTKSQSELTSYSFAESGDVIIDGYVSSEFDYPEFDYAGSTDVEYRIATAGDAMTIDVRMGESGADPDLEILPVYTAIHADLTADADEETGEIRSVGGTMTVTTAASGPETKVSLDMKMTMDMLPEGELLVLPEQVINPMEADEAALNAFTEQLFNMFMQFAASLIPTPEAPPTIGGALLS
ncbi:MAG: hypothetical protein IJE08_13705 [Clostridia bacterium]|nr:hypothetical protein [Clostridia bacterium]